MSPDPAPDPLVPLFHGTPNHCFGCSPTNPHGLQLKFTITADRSVLCNASVSEFYEGPPGYLHGGIIATILDEAMSKANRAHGVTAMTRQMNVEYLLPVPSNTPIRIDGHITRSEGRKHWTTSQIHNSEGKILAQATGLFIAIKS